MDRLTPFNLRQWVDDNRHLLAPPMLNKPLWRDAGFVAIVLAGPILRNDYHVNPYEEFFYQIEGNMTLNVVDDGRIEAVPIGEGDVFLLPARVPHSPQRPEPGSIGLVIERQRGPGENDRFEWYCEGCAARVHWGELHLDDFATARPKLFDAYYDDVARGTCPNCGAPNPKRCQ